MSKRCARPVSRQLESIRRTGKPFLLETATYRLRGHFEPDDQAYVDPAELAAWKQRDPIDSMKQRLAGSGLTSGDIEGLEARAAARLDAAVAFAQASPYPEAAELLTDVYA